MEWRRARSWWTYGAIGVLVFALGARVGGAEEQSRRVVIVTGIDYPGHKWKETAPALAAELRQDPRLKVDVVETPNFLATDKLKDYDTVVLHFMNWETPDPGEQARRNLAKFVSSGGGVVAVHFACGAFQGWPEFEKIIGRVYDPKLPPHDPYGPFEVRPTDVDHPITRGLEPFQITDELYTCLAGKLPIQSLAEAKSKLDGKNYSMAFILRYGKGRVFHSPLGHDVGAITNPGAAELFRRGCAWTAGLSPVGSVPVRALRSTGILPVVPDHGRDAHATKTPDGVTTNKKIAFLAGQPSHGEGCHDWYQDAEFVKECLLRAMNIDPPQIDIYRDGWPENAAALDDADAVIFFADGREHHPLAVPGRIEKMRELAKRGKGIAFLHYSIDPPAGAFQDFLDWTGGAYEVGLSQNPINVTKVTPVANSHPITRGCRGYVAEDEWYFDTRLRPSDASVAPLMTGRLPPREPQDKVLAWARTRPDGGRGFGFAGGHYDENWHMEPFRKLVLNGILWTAGMDVPAGGVASVQPWRFVSIPDFVSADLTYPQPGWEDTLDYVLKTIKAENPEFVLVAGDLVRGNWPDKDTIEKNAGTYYPAWLKRMEEHGLKAYAGLGDRDIGGAPWPAEKAKLVSTFKRQFQKYLPMPLNGPLRMKGTAYWFVHEDTLFVALDVFEKGPGGQNGIVPKVTGEQLAWLQQTLTDNPGVAHIVVMGHTPAVAAGGQDPAGLLLEGGRESPVWQTLQKHGADLYLCGAAHALSCTRADGVLQIAHGSLFGSAPQVNYLVATVYPERIDLELKEIPVVNEGAPLPQTGNNGPREKIRIPEDARQKGFVTVGTATLVKGQEAALVSPKGCIE
jgi:type 1 glutamine amidotransferase